MSGEGQRCRRGSAHAPHARCPGREPCARCGVLTWLDQMVRVTELSKYNGRYRHPGCRF